MGVGEAFYAEKLRAGEATAQRFSSTPKHSHPVRSMGYKCLLDYAATAGTVYIKGIVLR